MTVGLEKVKSNYESIRDGRVLDLVHVPSLASFFIRGGVAGIRNDEGTRGYRDATKCARHVHAFRTRTLSRWTLPLSIFKSHLNTDDFRKDVAIVHIQAQLNTDDLPAAVMK